MAEQSYLQWIAEETGTDWWHDSGDPDEVRSGLAQGAVGVTINPVLVYRCAVQHLDSWKPVFRSLPADLTPERRTQEMTRLVTHKVAAMLQGLYESSNGKSGYVCAQLNPAAAAERHAKGRERAYQNRQQPAVVLRC